MSYRVARERVVHIVEGTDVETSMDLGLARLIHSPDAGGNIDDFPVQTRHFWLEGSTEGDGFIVQPYTPDIDLQPRTRARVVCVIAYRDLKGRRTKMDYLLEHDAREVAKSFLRPSTYGQRAVSNLDYIEEVSWRREILPNDDVNMRISFTMHYI